MDLTFDIPRKRHSPEYDLPGYSEFSVAEPPMNKAQELALSHKEGQILEKYMSIDEQHLEIEDSGYYPYQVLVSELTEKLRAPVPLMLQNTFRTQEEAEKRSGILPQIHRVWFSVDNSLYLWDFYTEDNVISLPVANDIIVQVSIVPNNDSFFSSSVSFVLAVVTRSDIKIAGIILEPNFRILVGNQILPTDDTQIECVLPLENGRILLGGNDGNISELVYTKSFFSQTKRFKKQRLSENPLSLLIPKFLKNLRRSSIKCMSIDSSRNLLYALVSYPRHSAIHVYNLGEFNTGFTKIFTISSEELMGRLKSIAMRTSNLPDERLEIVHVSAVPLTISSSYNLQVITKNSIRIYISIEGKTYYLFPRFPPAGVPEEEYENVTSTYDKYADCRQCCYSSQGILLMQENLELMLISRSLPRIAHRQTEPSGRDMFAEESIYTIPMEGEIRNMAEIPIEFSMTKTEAQLCNYTTQNEFIPKIPLRYLNEASVSLQCLTSLASHLYLPPQEFVVLTDSQLILLAHNRPIDRLLSAFQEKNNQKINKFIEQYGSIHTCTMILSLLTTKTTLPEDIKMILKDAFAKLGNLNSSESTSFSYRPEDPVMTLVEYKAYYMHLGRIVKPIWNASIVYSSPEYLVCRFSSEQLSHVKSKLVSLMDLVSTDQDAFKKFRILVTRIKDTIELMDLINDHYKFRGVLAGLTEEEHSQLLTMTYREMVATSEGTMMGKTLVDAYVKHIQNPRSARNRVMPLDQCLKMVNELCPSYFGHSDSELFIAEECLRKATAFEENKNEYIEEAMKRLIKNSDDVRLQKVVPLLKQLKFFKGIIMICFEKAKKLTNKSEAYQPIFQLLDEIQSSIDFPHTRQLEIPRQELPALRSSVIKDCGQFKEQHLHFSLFLWLSELKLENEILLVDSPFTKEYIEMYYSTHKRPESSLIAKYSLNVKDFRTAFKELVRLATLKDTNLAITERLNYLDLAIDALQKTEHTSEELRNVESLLKTAKVQKKIQDCLNAQRKHDRAAELNWCLYTLTELYQNYASTHDMFEIMFDIFHYSKEISPDSFELESMKLLFSHLIYHYSTNNWPHALKGMLLEIGNKYPYCFDLPNVIKNCEYFNISHQEYSNWVIELILSMNLKEGFSEVWEIYFYEWKENSDHADYCWLFTNRLCYLLLNWVVNLQRKYINLSSFSSLDKAPIAGFHLRSSQIEEFINTVFQVIDILPNERQNYIIPRLNEVYAQYQQFKKEFNY